MSRVAAQPIREDIAHALAIAAARHGMTMAALARASGVSRGSLYAMIVSTQPPSLSMLEQLATALGCRVEVALVSADAGDTPRAASIRATPDDLLRLRSRPNGIDVCTQLARLHPAFAGLMPPWPADEAVRDACAQARRSYARAAAQLQVPIPWLRKRMQALGLSFARPARVVHTPTSRQPLTAADIADIHALAAQFYTLREIAARYNRTRERIRQIVATTPGARYAERAARARAQVAAHVQDLLRTTTDIDAVVQQAAAASPLSLPAVRAVVRRVASALIRRQARTRRIEQTHQRRAIAQRLRDAMTARGMTSADLAVVAGVSPGIIRHLCTGRAGSRHLPPLAARLGVSLDWLVHGTTGSPADVVTPSA